MTQPLADISPPASGDNLPMSGAAVADPLPRAALVAELAADNGLVRTELELAALLESHGVTDDVATRYGAHDVFDLAQQLLPDLKPAILPLAKQPAPPSPRALPTIMRGPLLLLMIGMAMVGLRFYEAALRSQGAAAWATSLGLAAGMAIACAIMPALGWRISIALSQRMTDTIRVLALAGLGIGTGIAGGVALLLVGIGALLRQPLAGLVGLGVSCVGLTVWLLMSGTLIVLNHTLVPSVAPGVAFGAAWLADRLGLAIYGQLPVIALGAAAVLLMLAGWLAIVLRRLPLSGQPRGMYPLPPTGQIVYNAAPYASYGALAVLYVFIGPLGGWFGHLTPGWTREPAIAAMNIVHLLGFATVIVSQGVVEYALRTFWSLIRTAEQQVVCDDLPAIRVVVWRFVRRNLWMLLAVQIASAYGLARLAPWLWDRYELAPILGPLVPVLLFTSLLGSSYLAWGLYNCSLLVALGQPWRAARALLGATVVEIGAMILFDLAGGFQATIIGPVTGSACLAIITQRMLNRLLARADYALYRAF